MTDTRSSEHAQPAPLLAVEDLRVRFATPSGVETAVDGVSFEIRPRDLLGVAGESGSGKSVTSLAILGLLSNAAVSGSVRLNGEELLTASIARMRQVRGGHIGYVFQDPLASLDPVRTVGHQIGEVLRLKGISRSAARQRTLDMMAAVGISNAAGRIDDYPHQFSGGMRQRVMIAMALIAEPRLVIADEPTTALDVRIQQQVVDLLLDLADKRDLAVMLISHDLGILAGFADNVLVMHRGKIVERASVFDVFARPKAEYTRQLLGALPRMDGPRPRRLATMTATQTPEGGNS